MDEEKLSVEAQGFGTELLKVIREISDHAGREGSRVWRIYRTAAYCLVAIITFGIYFTYKDAAEFRRESRAEIETQRKLISGEIERQEKQMHERQEALFLQMRIQLSQQVDVLGRKVEERVNDEFKKENISKLVTDKAQERIDAIADPLITEKISKKIQPKIDDVNKSLQQTKGEIQTARDEVKKVHDDADYLNIVSKAQNDDRSSFDQLKSWADDPNFYRQKDAAKARRQIIDGTSSVITYTYDFPWKEGLDPSKLSFEQLKSSFGNLDVYTKMALLQYIWKRTDFTKKQKMGLMVDVMKKDESLKVVAEASRLFQSESKQKIKPLAVDHMFDWWEKNEAAISDKPESETQQK